MIRYLEYYHRLPGYKAYDGKITDISLGELVFSRGNETYKTAISPPMTSYREARERVVQMDKECIAGLRRSDITVSEYIRPRGVYLASFLIVSATFISFSRRATFEPDGLVATYVHSGFARFCWTVQPWVLYSM